MSLPSGTTKVERSTSSELIQYWKKYGNQYCESYRWRRRRRTKLVLKYGNYII
jgi:uncharacterized protein YjiS (DUF1127 family)